ncbi:organic hydroperoxide resistance protein [Bacillus sp. MUM 13]|uniref:organic hydroperoxide resistance protein n=1 Tax=Bacillus sp. MUM 13 TaxID=1678001 RepID=UPI0008F57C10|nr:organic hydroperoxide resistance protein [Bacillus sp. MUM 13]OIK14520.1 hypothetical protein BIV59_03015 [Bacillus sp. MUM 13]
MKPLYTAAVTTEGGRDGHVKSEDGILDFDVRTPKEMGGSRENATNPEQLFAAGYSACFGSALNLVLSKARKKTDSSVTANVTIGKDEADGGFKLAVRLDVSLPDLEREEAKSFMEKAHEVCPYSKATRNNIDVTLILV